MGVFLQRCLVTTKHKKEKRLVDRSGFHKLCSKESIGIILIGHREANNESRDIKAIERRVLGLIFSQNVVNSFLTQRIDPFRSF